MQDDKTKLFIMQEIMAKSFSSEELEQIKEKILSLQRKDNNTIAKMGVVNFTEKELNTMPKHIKKLLILDKKRCRLRTKQSGENSVSYEIRYRANGYNISASGKTIELAKANFINKCKTADKTSPKQTAVNVPQTFDAFASYYFDNFRKEKVSALTLRNDLNRYKHYLKPHFKQTPIKNITPSECKKLLDKVKEQGKGKTADELHSLLNVVFKSAIAHGIIERNPLDIVLHIQHERKSGKALTREEENTLKTALNGSKHLQSFMLLLYTGLRPNELKTAKIDGGFIIAQNSKRKNKKIAYKKIPILKALKPYLSETLTLSAPYTLREKLKNILPNHILYDLRTTFYTRCDEFNVSAVARDEFVGHSNGALTSAYRDLSDDFLIKESKKLDKWV